MSKRLWPILLLIAAPVLLGALAYSFIPPVPPFLFNVDLGILAFVFGATIRDIGLLLFIFGVIVSLLLVLVYVLNRQRERQTHQLLENAFREAEQGRRRFLRRLDHEIKNPLTGLQAALVNLRETRSGEDRERAAQNADRAVQRLSRLLADLRKLSELEERPLERLPVDISQLLQEMIDAACSVPAHEGRQINLTITHVPWPLPVFTGDRDLLGLAVYNLIENALKFTSRNDTVEVRGFEDGRAIVIEVADSGQGIPSEELSKIFEELYRGSNARGAEGSGLGLALVNRIVALHGGQISVRSSQGRTRGTVFTMRLPV